MVKKNYQTRRNFALKDFLPKKIDPKIVLIKKKLNHKFCLGQKKSRLKIIYNNKFIWPEKSFSEWKFWANLFFSQLNLFGKKNDCKKKSFVTKYAYGRHQLSWPMCIVEPIQIWRNCVIYLYFFLQSKKIWWESKTIMGLWDYYVKKKKKKDGKKKLRGGGRSNLF